MIRIIALLSTLAFLSSPSFANDKALEQAVAAAKSGKVTLLMQKKLEYSKALWEGVTRENFPMIVENLKKLDRVAREATWQSLRTKDYQRYSRMFQNTVEELLEKSEKNDIEAIALPFVRLNLNCMECHELVRSKIYKNRAKGN